MAIVDVECSQRLGQELDAVVAAGALQLPMLPDVVMRVTTLCNDPDCDARQLAELIRADQSLMAHLLREANSAAMGSRVPIASLQLAVSRIGLGRIRAIALEVACKTVVFRVDGRESLMRDLFRHALAVGLTAQEIARSRRMNVEEAFTAGLLHDVGRPVAIEAVLGLASRDGLAPDDDDLETICHPRHAAIGAELVASWGLPERLQVVARHHHDPEQAGPAEALARVVRLADEISSTCFEVDAAVARTEFDDDPDVRALNLYPDDVMALLAHREAVLAQLEAIG